MEEITMKKFNCKYISVEERLLENGFTKITNDENENFYVAIIAQKGNLISYALVGDDFETATIYEVPDDIDLEDVLTRACEFDYLNDFVAKNQNFTVMNCLGYC